MATAASYLAPMLGLTARIDAARSMLGSASGFRRFNDPGFDRDIVFVASTVSRRGTLRSGRSLFRPSIILTWFNEALFSTDFRFSVRSLPPFPLRSNHPSQLPGSV